VGGTFKPASVSVKVGDAVQWTWVDPNAPHSATADDGSTFDSGVKEKGASYQYTFKKAGTFKYHCSVHPAMLGTVMVS
jgi:plastocyanin